MPDAERLLSGGFSVQPEISVNNHKMLLTFAKVYVKLEIGRLVFSQNTEIHQSKNILFDWFQGSKRRSVSAFRLSAQPVGVYLRLLAGLISRKAVSACAGAAVCFSGT